MVKGNWDVRRTSKGAVATYQGLGGVGQVVRGLSRTAQGIGASAVGSKVSFEIEKTSGGYTECSMWLSEHSTRFGFTNDAGVFRRYMQSVQKHLRKLDSRLQVARDGEDPGARDHATTSTDRTPWAPVQSSGPAVDVAPAKPGEQPSAGARHCVSGSCDARGLPTAHHSCPDCGQRTQLRPLA